MAEWKPWLDMAHGSLKSGVELQQTDARSAISRFYYAVYQAGTAVLLYRRLTPPPPREAWSHADTPPLLMESLRSLLAPEDKEET